MIPDLDAKGKLLAFMFLKPEAGCPQISCWRSKCLDTHLSDTVRSLKGPYQCVFKQFCAYNMVELQVLIGENCFGVCRFPLSLDFYGALVGKAHDVFFSISSWMCCVLTQGFASRCAPFKSVSCWSP